MRGYLVFLLRSLLAVVLLVLPGGPLPKVEKPWTAQQAIAPAVPSDATDPAIESHPSQAPTAYKLYGLNFSPYTELGQDADLGTPVTEEQIRKSLAIVAPYTNWVRIFGTTHGLESVGRIAHEHGLKVAVGASLGKPGIFSTVNEEEIASLIMIGQAGEADLLVVGTETLYRDDLDEKKLIEYILKVKQAVPGIPVATADVFDKLLEHPAVMAAGDVVLVNYYPHWLGMPVDEAIAGIYQEHQRVVAAAGGRLVIVSETGWPSAGDTVDGAVPSAENASLYFLNFVSWARAENVPYFYFEAFDEPARGYYDGPEGAHFGIWDTEGKLKPGMEEVFAGKTNWSVPGGPGVPTVGITSIPPYGSADKLKGQVWHVNPAEYKVAVYVKAWGRWWTKTGWTYPLTFVNPDGFWATDIAMGGFDEEVTMVAAFLVPNGYKPPLMPQEGIAGGAAFPQALQDAAVAAVFLDRGP